MSNGRSRARGTHHNSMTRAADVKAESEKHYDADPHHEKERGEIKGNVMKRLAALRRDSEHHITTDGIES